MGLAVLPGRLQKELSLIQRLLTGTGWDALSEAEQDSLIKHKPWIDRMQRQYGVIADPAKAEAVLQQEVGEIFSQVLEDAGVYKNTADGVAAFDRFMLTAGFMRK